MILHRNLNKLHSPGSLWTCSQLNRRRLLGTRAASLSLPMPLSGGLSSLVSLSSTPASNNPPGLLQSSAASPSGKLTVDPRASGEDVTVIHSPEELTEILAANSDKVICLMCKALGCRPCKVFARKYQRLAAAYKHCMFLECTGDETVELRKLMIQMGIRSTPTFRLYKAGECIKTVVGIDDQKLKAAVDSCLEAGGESAKEQNSPPPSENSPVAPV